MTTRAALPGRLFPSRQSRRRWPLALILAVASLAGCSRQGDVPFRVDNARAHLDRLTNAGPRPTGSSANAAARAYLVDQLRLYGFDVRTQTVDASRPEYGRTMRVTNIVATRAGSRQDAIALVAHYDSVPIAPGAMDDGIGTAVALEAARLLAAAPALRHTLVVLLTDGEEFGLMGAVGAMNDAELRARLKGYVNLESTGSTGPAILFESGPGNEALIRAWANGAPRPHGASFALEIYKRLPNDTDFTILKAAGIPGLNMAPVGNSHAYHTSRDTADRVASDTLLHMGESVVTTMRAMDALDRLKADRDVRFASIGETHGDRAGRLAGPAPRDPGDRPRPRRLDPDRAPPRRRRRDPLHRHRAVGDPGARLRRSARWSARRGCWSRRAPSTIPGTRCRCGRARCSWSAARSVPGC